MDENQDLGEEVRPESFRELLRYTAIGFIGGLIVATVLDWLGFQRNALGQWLVRTLAGEGESICEGIYALRRRLTGSAASMAESYGWGKLFGMTVPWIVDATSRAMGIDVFSVEGFYIPYFYAMSDQIGANVAGLVHLRRTEGTWRKSIASYVRHPVMLTSISSQLGFRVESGS